MHAKRIKNSDQLNKSKRKALVKNMVLFICSSTRTPFSLQLWNLIPVIYISTLKHITVICTEKF